MLVIVVLPIYYKQPYVDTAHTRLRLDDFQISNILIQC